MLSVEVLIFIMKSKRIGILSNDTRQPKVDFFHFRTVILDIYSGKLVV